MSLKPSGGGLRLEACRMAGILTTAQVCKRVLLSLCSNDFFRRFGPVQSSCRTEQEVGFGGIVQYGKQFRVGKAAFAIRSRSQVKAAGNTPSPVAVRLT